MANTVQDKAWKTWAGRIYSETHGHGAEPRAHFRAGFSAGTAAGTHGLPPNVLDGLVHLRDLVRVTRERSESVEAACSWIDGLELGLDEPPVEPIEVSGDAANYIRELQDRNARLKRRVGDLQELVRELESK